MADIKLFKIDNGVEELPATLVSLERELQTLIEKNMLPFLELLFENRNNYDYFISFHRNAFKPEQARGIETYIYTVQVKIQNY